MDITMKLYFPLIFAFVSFQSYAVVDCENSPKDAVTELKEPLSQWASIKCINSNKQFVLVPANGLKWLSETKKPMMLVAGSLGNSSKYVDASAGEAPKKWNSYFVKQAFKKIKGMGIVGANVMLNQETKQAAKFGRIYQLSLVANNKTVHQIFFYGTHSTPVWVMLCKNQCKTKDVFRVVK